MPRHSPYALYSLNLIFTLFSINCFSLSIAWVSFDNFYHWIVVTLFRSLKRFYPLHWSFRVIHLSSFATVANCSLSTILGKTVSFLVIGIRTLILLPLFLKQFFSIICSFYSISFIRFSMNICFLTYFDWIKLNSFSVSLFRYSLFPYKSSGCFVCLFSQTRLVCNSPARCAGGGLKWTRTIDLALIRRAL